MVRSTSRSRVYLNSSSLHCITDQDCFVDVFRENTTLKQVVHKQSVEDAG
jgi:hypothetical protein